MAHIYRRCRQFWISYYLDGKLIQKSLKTKDERTALSKQKRIEYELSIGDLHVASKLPLPIVLEVFCKYLKNTRTFKSYKNDVCRLRTFFGPICDGLKPYPGTMKQSRKDKYEGSHVKAELLEDITAGAINRFIAARIEEDKWKPKTANLMREVLHKLYAYAIKHHGFCSRDRRYPNPADAVERLRESAPQIRFLTLEDIDKQLQVLADYPVIHAMVAVYIYAGLRREEVLWLTGEDVDLEQRVIRVRAKTIDKEYWQPKTKKNRVVPISNALYDILSIYQPLVNCVWFFPSPTGKKWNTDNFSQDLREINKENNLEWSCLDFRHTFGSQLAQKGESLYKIAELMGNSPDICRRHYAALVPEKMRDTVEFSKTQIEQQGGSKDAEVMLRQILEKLDGNGSKLIPEIRLVR
ncbi:MAG: tyrosine-type recombinase/integrase [Phycisphaerae bacterium]